MKIIGICGSPRNGGNTEILINTVFSVLKEKGVETELIRTAGLKLEGCNACGACFRNKNGKCIIQDDMNPIITKMTESDGMIIGSPTYFADVTPEIKAVIDRAGYVTRANGLALSRKIGAAVMAVRRAGSIHGYETINNFFLINDMIVPGSSYWNIGVGREKGDVLQDSEGIETVKRLGENIAWLLKKLRNPVSGGY